MPGIRDHVRNWNNSWVIHLTACEGSDDFSVCNGYFVKAQQKCLAHLQGTTVLEKGEGLFSVSVGTDELSVCMKPSPFSIVNIPRRHFKKVIKLGHGNNAVARRFLQGGRNPLELFVGHHELSVLYQGSALPVDGIGEGQAFLDLIDEAFTKHRQWRQTQDTSAYLTWAEGFKLRVQQSVQQWIGRAGYEAGLLLRARTGKPPWGIATGRRYRNGGISSTTRKCHRTITRPSEPERASPLGASLRLAVTKRKVSGGSRSMGRFAQTADLLSVIQTCRRQGRSVMEFFREALMAQSRSGISQPSLLPQPTT